MSVLWAKRGWMSGGTFVPHQLFASGAQGAWYDPSDYSTLFQDAAGTTPVTAVEQPVRLMLDRSRGLVLGPELWGTPTLSGSSWAWDGTTLTGLGVTTGTATGSAVVAGRSYRITMTVSATGSNLFQVRVGNSFIATLAGGANTTYTYIVVASNTTGLEFTSSGGTTGTITNISVRELPGNHAVAPNDASRPVLRARYNQLTFSEQFDNGVWAAYGSKTITANSSVAPDGTTTADTFTSTAAGNGINQINIAVSASTTYRFSLFAKVGAQGTKLSVNAPQYNSGSTYLGDLFSASPDINTGVALANGWYRHDFNGTTAATAAKIDIRIVAHANNDAYIIWGADLKTAADAAATGNAYQRIAAATDYDVSNPVFRPYLAFDGSDDTMTITSSIHDVYQNVGNGTMWAGYTSIQTGVPVIFVSRNVNTSPRAGINSSGATGRRLDADSTANALDSGYAANAIYVATTVSDWAGGNIIRRTNGVQVASAAYSSGAGNTSNTASAQASLGANAANLLTGRLYSAIILGRAATDAELTATESWINGKTGGY